jgi:S-adenosylmethionine:tRNA ribosyltransferase-isomerase
MLRLDTIQLSDFQYNLPDSSIARYPVEPRDSSKLLVYKSGKISHQHFVDLTDFLPKNSFLVFNDTKVIPARIHFQKSTGSVIEIFLLQPHSPTRFVHEAMQVTDTCVWECMIGNKKRWKNGEILKFELVVCNVLSVLEVKLIDSEQNLVRFSWKNTSQSSIAFVDVVQALGQIPLPPYLKRKTENKDIETYQTVYSKSEGAVAAPTAGLHFTERVFEQMIQKKIGHSFVTLHVGAGTFMPVKVQNVAEHTMHSEQVVYSKPLIEDLIKHNGKTIAVGTTSMRSLESLYWFGVKLLSDCKSETITVPIANQDEQSQLMPFRIEKLYPYSIETPPTAIKSLTAILEYMTTNSLSQLVGETEIMILPGYQFKICKGLITNYHQPESTLMLLVSAFIGNDWKRVYEEAIQNNYRFLSYGDSSLLLP